MSATVFSLTNLPSPLLRIHRIGVPAAIAPTQLASQSWTLEMAVRFT